MENTNLHQKSSKNIRQAIGVGLFLLDGVLLVSPATHVWGLGYGVFYLFGIAGYWAILPFLLIVASLLSIKGQAANRVFSWRIYVGFFLFVLGFSILFSHFAMNGKEDFTTAKPFLDLISHYQTRETAAGLFLAKELGGGIVGYYLSALLLKPGVALLYTVGIVLVVGGFILVFFPLFKLLFKVLARFFHFVGSKITAAREQEKMQEEAEEMAERNGFGSSISSPEEPLSKETPVEESAPSKTESPRSEPILSDAIMPSQTEKATSSPDGAAMSRSQKYGEKPQTFVPEDLTYQRTLSQPTLSPREMARAGLQEAVFIADGIPAPVLTEAKATLSTPVDVITKTMPASSEIARKNETSEPACPAPEASIEPLFSPNFISPAPEDNENKPADATSDVPFSSTVVGSSIPSAPSPDISPVLVEPITKKMPENVIVPPRNDAETKPAVEKQTTIPAAPIAAVSSPAVTHPSSEEEPQLDQPKASPRPSYKFPPVDLLKTYPDQGNLKAKQEECDHRVAIINQAFADLHAGAQVVSYTIGPSVTRYDVQTNVDVSVSSIGRFVKDVSVRLGGVATRYEEVVRGKSTSGLEIANSQTTIVSLKEMVTALPQGSKCNLFVPFGKSISGECISADLSEFPHMLVAGTTGSGKSIFMHGIIMSLIMRNRPEDLKLVVVDPKRVEMSKYKDLPHLLCPIIKEPTEAKICFQKLIGEMERRYTLFELSGVSNIRQFNTEYAPDAGLEKLPFIVIVIDEYADLVDSCKDIGDSVVRLAQKARAAGIHLVIATQRPSVNVITGVVKANLPCRVALSMNNPTDSITILGQGGAEDLVGHGDMLVDCSLVARNGFTRCQGCLVDNGEIKAVADFIKSEAVVHYDDKFLDLVDHEAEQKAEAAAAPVISKSELREAAGDDLYNEIKADIMTKEYTSISRIQREYSVGFPRAGKIFARLQAEGIVAAEPDTSSSSKGCRVLLHEQSGGSVNPGSTDQSGANALAGGNK